MTDMCNGIIGENWECELITNPPYPPTLHIREDQYATPFIFNALTYDGVGELTMERTLRIGATDTGVLIVQLQ